MKPMMKTKTYEFHILVCDYRLRLKPRLKVMCFKNKKHVTLTRHSLFSLFYCCYTYGNSNNNNKYSFKNTKVSRVMRVYSFFEIVLEKKYFFNFNLFLMS